MKMISSIIQYIRDWFPSSTATNPSELSRKRKGSVSLGYPRNSKHRRTLSPILNGFEDEVFISPVRSSVLRPLNSTSRTIIIDDDDHVPLAMKPSRKSSENRAVMNGNDDLHVLQTVKSTTEKRLDAKKSGYEYITRFSSSGEPASTKTPPNLRNGAKPKSKLSPILKNSKTPTKSPRDSFSTPTLNYSFRLEDKKKYEKLLECAALQSSFNTSSIYGTPMSGFNRSRKLVEMVRSPKFKKFEVIDLTNESKTRLSTSDTVKKVLNNFENETAVIEDSDSDVEILPTPPSPKPDIKVDPVNSLKTVIDTSETVKEKWLGDKTRNHERLLEDRNREIQAYSENSSALHVINEDLLIRKLRKRVTDSLAIKDEILPVKEEEEETELPELTDEQLRSVKRAFTGDPNEILTKKFNLNVNRRDIQTLAGLNWLNDNVINFYMNLITERGTDSKWPRCYTMNTFFYQKLSTAGPESLKRWTRRVDIFSYELICVPIHLGMHWCMAIINLKERTIKYYDSMGKPNNQCLNHLRGYLEFEHMDKKKEPFSTKDFILENVQDIPQQMNGSDCGMFSCTFAEFATRRAKFSFQQSDMPYLRKKMVVEILTGQLLIS